MTTNHNNRINPRRPFKNTASGVKRIVLTTAPRVNEQPHAKPVRKLQHGIAENSAKQLCIVVITHSDRGMLDDHARQTIAAAAILANDDTNNDVAVITLILGDLRENIANCGADQVIVMPEFSFEKFQPDLELTNITSVIERLKPIKIFMPDNLIGDGDLGRRLIASQQAKTAATHAIEIDAHHVASLHAAGRKIASTEVPDIVLLAAYTVDTDLPFVGSAERNENTNIQRGSTGSDQKSISPYQNLGLKTIATEQVALEEADLIVSAGNGVNNVATFEQLARSLDAAIGASRVAVDDGKFTRDKQIGASGKTVTASTYIAIGISGAVQHLQGIKDCRHVIAINRDNSAPIIKRADLSVIGDAEAIMQALITLIGETKIDETHVIAEAKSSALQPQALQSQALREAAA